MLGLARIAQAHRGSIPAGFYPLTLNNASSPVDTSGWTNRTGTLMVGGGSVSYFYSRSATLRAYQDVMIPVELLPAVVSGNAYAAIEWNPGGYSGDNDAGEIELISVAGATELSTVASRLMSWDISPSDAIRQNFAVPIAASADRIRVQMHAARYAGTDNNAYFDKLALSLLVCYARKAWRIYITSNNGSTGYHQLLELQFRKEVGGNSIARFGSSFASSEYAGTSTYASFSSALAFNGDTTSANIGAPDVWASLSGTGTVPAFVGYICPTTDVVNEVAIWNRVTSSGDPTSAPKDFTIQSSTDTTNGSDGTWADEWSVTGQTGWTAGQLRTFARP